MTDQELLQAIRAITREEMKPLKEEMKEDLSEVRTGVNMLINWSEKVSMAATLPCRT